LASHRGRLINVIRAAESYRTDLANLPRTRP
jgi:hypothetical protein